jgi:hypothetical protein
MTTPQPEVRHYALTLTVPEAPASTAQASLVVRPFMARDPYDQERIVYRSSPYQLDFYNYHRWAASPADLVTDWTRRYLSGTGLFAKVAVLVPVVYHHAAGRQAESRGDCRGDEPQPGEHPGAAHRGPRASGGHTAPVVIGEGRGLN